MDVKLHVTQSIDKAISSPQFPCLQLDLREQGLLRFSASAPYPLITFGPYPSPDKVVAALARATGEALRERPFLSS